MPPTLEVQSSHALSHRESPRVYFLTSKDFSLFFSSEEIETERKSRNREAWSFIR